jgi:hypothetical protein
MTPLDKDDLQKLSPEQQMIMAQAAAQRLRTREDLWNQARVVRGMDWIAGLGAGMAMGLAMLSVVYPKTLMFAIIALTALVNRHACGLNQRLDAVLKLLEAEQKNAAK